MGASEVEETTATRRAARMLRPMLLALFLAACADGGDSAPVYTDECTAAGDPEVTLVAPEASSTFVEGEEVALEAEGEGVGGMFYSWAVDGDVFDTGQTSTWIATVVGDHVITVQLQDDCGVVQDNIPVRVAAAE